MFRLDRAVEALAQIKLSTNKDRPLQWSQGDWGSSYVGGDMLVDKITGLPMGTASCKTGMCMAGWGLTLGGVRLNWELADVVDGISHFIVERTADGASVAEAGAAYFGIERGTDLWPEYDEMPRLFSTGNTFEDLVRIIADHDYLTETEVHRLVDEEIERTPVFTIGNLA